MGARTRMEFGGWRARATVGTRVRGGRGGLDGSNAGVRTADSEGHIVLVKVDCEMVDLPDHRDAADDVAR